MRMFNLTKAQFHAVMHGLGGLFNQSRPTQGPDFNSFVTETDNEALCDLYIHCSGTPRGYTSDEEK